MPKPVLILLVACFVYNDCLSQQYPFVYYTPKDGLVNSRVRRIKQDSKGRMYFVTYGGLSIYDGTRFTNYSQEDGLANELVNDVIEITPDSFLVATNTTALNTIVNGRVGTFKTADGFCPLINRFFKSKDGNLYVTGDHGLYKLSGNRFIALPFVDTTGREIGLNLDGINEFGDYFFIMPWHSARAENLLVYSKKRQRVVDILAGEKVLSTEMDTKGNFWITTSESVRMLDTAAAANGRIALKPLPAGLSHLSSWKNTAIIFDTRGTGWLYNANNIIRIEPDGHVQTFSLQYDLRTSSLNDLYVDREGIAWMAAGGNGVIKMPGTYIELLKEISPGQPVFMSGISARGDSTWFYNASNNKLYLDYKNSLKTFSLSDKPRIFGNLYTYGEELYVADNKIIIHITNTADVSAFKNLTGKTYHVPPGWDLANGIIDRNGMLIQHLGRSDSVHAIAVFKGTRKLMEHRISYMSDQMAVDKQGRIWVITRNKHLLVFSTHPNQPEKYLQLQKDFMNDLPEMSPRSVTIDDSGNVWVGSRYNGLYLFKFNNLELVSTQQFTTRQGLTDNFIYCLLTDDENNIWAGTQTGLDKISMKDGKYTVWNVTKSNDFFYSIYRIAANKDGTIWSITNDGRAIKIASRVKVGGPRPQLLLTSLMVNDQHYPDSIRQFSHKLNNFSFTIAAPTFLDEKSTMYSYILEGSGKTGWSDPSNNARFNFINLSPGYYKLKVRADFPASVYPEQFLEYSFIIKPPWWQTWWFKILMGLTVIGIIILFIGGYYQRKLRHQKDVLERKRAIENERTRIATDMHDDLGAGLSTIRFLSEKVKRNTFSEITKNDADKIVTNSHELVQKMNEIIWAMNEKNDTLEHLVFYTRSYAMEFCEEHQLDCAIRIPEAIPHMFIRGEVRRNVFLTVKESLNNIVKHADADRVEIEFAIDKHLSVVITDNGKGFGEKINGYQGNGLRNMAKRIQSIEGVYELKSGNGVTVKIDVPL